MGTIYDGYSIDSMKHEYFSWDSLKGCVRTASKGLHEVVQNMIFTRSAVRSR